MKTMICLAMAAGIFVPELQLTTKQKQGLDAAKKICEAVQKWEDAFGEGRTETVEIRYTGTAHITCKRGDSDVLHDRPTRSVQEKERTRK